MAKEKVALLDKRPNCDRPESYKIISEQEIADMDLNELHCPKCGERLFGEKKAAKRLLKATDPFYEPLMERECMKNLLTIGLMYIFPGLIGLLLYWNYDGEGLIASAFFLWWGGMAAIKIIERLDRETEGK